MKSPLGTAVRPALVSLLLLGAAACGPTPDGSRTVSVGVDAPSAVPVAATGPASAGPRSGDGAASGTVGTPTAHASAAAKPSGKATAPATGGPSAAAPTTPAPAAAVPSPAITSPLPVAAALPGDRTVAISTPSTDGSAATPATAATDLRLTAYDPAAGTAVLSAGAAPSANAAPSAAPAPSASSPAPSSSPFTQAVQAGRLLASPPTEAAPQGALLAVTAVRPGAGNTLALTTRPATLPELLGAAEADGTVAVDPRTIKVVPLVKDVTATVGRDNGTTKAEASGTLEVDAKAPIPLPGGVTAEASGELSLHPAVRFAYHGAGPGTPRTASIGFDLGARAHWKVTGDFNRATATPVRVPFAKLQASPVLTVAGLPVVVNLGLTCYLEVGADGQVHVEAEQEATGTWAVRADYTGGRGWTSSADAPDTKVSPVHVRLNGKAAVRATLGTEVSVGLYDAVGVEATVAPYLQARADGSLAVDVPGGTPQLQGNWGLHGGIDLTGALLAHLKVFGTPLIEGRLPLPAFHREWPLLTGSLPAPAPKG